MDVQFTLFGWQEEIKVKKLCKIKSLRQRFPPRKRASGKEINKL